jgi:hypothetical protein
MPRDYKAGSLRFFNKRHTNFYLDMACRTCGAEVGQKCDMVKHPIRGTFCHFHRARRWDSEQAKSLAKALTEFKPSGYGDITGDDGL